MIGIFDSGVGGLTVAKAIKESMPESKLIYFGDTARVPWGNKSPELVKKYSEEICDFLISKGAKTIVIACNTASAYAYDHLKEKYPQLKIYDAITPVVEKIESENGGMDSVKIAVLGTRGTIGSGTYQRKIAEKVPGAEVIAKACPLFVPLAEEGLADSEIAKSVLDEYLHGIKDRGVDMVVLGCTHYPLMKKGICGFFGEKTRCIGSDEEIARKLKAESAEGLAEASEDEFYFSDLSESYLELAGNIYGRKIKAAKIDLQ